MDLQKEKSQEEKLSEKVSTQESSPATVKVEQTDTAVLAPTEQKDTNKLEIPEIKQKEEKESELSTEDKKEVCFNVLSLLL